MFRHQGVVRGIAVIASLAGASLLTLPRDAAAQVAGPVFGAAINLPGSDGGPRRAVREAAAPAGLTSGLDVPVGIGQNAERTASTPVLVRAR